MTTRVFFSKRYGAWWPGADPTISSELAAKLIEGGYCKLYDQPAPVAVQEKPAEAAPQKDSDPVAESDNEDVSNDDDSPKRGFARRSSRSKKPTADSK